MANHVQTLAAARVKQAKLAAVKEGVLPNYEDEPLAPGSYKSLFDGEHVAIDLLVKSPSTSVDAKKLTDFLIGAGVDEALLNRAVTHASKQSRAAHVFSSRIKVEDEE